MIYNFNLGIGWASSGVEYAQMYRARMFRDIHAPARFIFTDMFPHENIERYTRHMGFPDEEIIWLYTFFTDFPVAPVTWTLEDFQKTIGNQAFRFTRDGKTGRMVFYAQEGQRRQRAASDRGESVSRYCTLYFEDEKSNLLHRVEYVSKGYLIRKDYFTFGRVYAEYYAPLDGKAHLYLRRFFNTDGSVAYEEITDDGDVMYRFPDQIFYSKEELVGYMVRRLGLTKDDVVIIDRTTGIGQAILQNCGEARTGIVVHADHYSAGGTNRDHVLWNNYYEYSFDMHRHISFYVASTEKQKERMEEQFQEYVGTVPQIAAIPVGSLDRLRYPDPEKGRKPFSIITVSRLASEKHIDWAIEACELARERVPELTLDICGEGGERDTLRKLIAEKKAGGWARLLGQQDVTDMYQRYELYLSASTSEGFGLSLMEAVGGGLPIIGFDVPYGNPTFVDDGEDGYLVESGIYQPQREKVRALADAIVRYFTEADRGKFHAHAYEVASRYLTERVEQRWKNLIADKK